MKRVILFDFDGTLVDSAPSICAGLTAALTALGLPVPSDAELRACIGLPLIHVWRRLGIPDSHHDAAVAGYRAWSAGADRKPVPVFPGMGELLTELHGGGRTLVLASAKDTASARRAVLTQGWGPMFVLVSGAEPGDGPHKRALVARALEQLPEDRRGDAVMVGDMAVDGDAAAANGIAFIAVAWGNGGRDELLAQRPVALVADAGELGRLLA